DQQVPVGGLHHGRVVVRVTPTVEHLLRRRERVGRVVEGLHVGVLVLARPRDEGLAGDGVVHTTGDRAPGGARRDLLGGGEHRERRCRRRDQARGRPGG